MKILLIEDEKITRFSLSNILISNGYFVKATGNGIEGFEIFKSDTFDLVISDLRLPGMDGMELLEKFKELNPACTVIIITAFATVETAIEALKKGAYDYLTKPFSPEKLLSMIENIAKLKLVIEENEKLKKRISLLEGLNLIGNSEPMKNLNDRIKIIANNDFSVLIEGESGTGKELVARILHNNSPRQKYSFIPVNCAALPESLLESELFGHEKGSFTGAIKQRIGFFERANKGTLFIDDIDDFPLPLQVKLLRVLQERVIQRVGGSESIPIDVRIITATKADLSKMVSAGQFREDLYYRLNILPLKLPPLRQRLEDIPLLVEHFYKKHNSPELLHMVNKRIFEKLMAYHWPGNVRELENMVERMIALSAIGNLEETLAEILSVSEPQKLYNTESEKKESVLVKYPEFEEYINQKEFEIISWAMKESDNNISQAAKLLNLPRTTLSSKLNKIKTGNPQFKDIF
jgi:DNA-binding NtrC family response regulator